MGWDSAPLFMHTHVHMQRHPCTHKCTKLYKAKLVFIDIQFIIEASGDLQLINKVKGKTRLGHLKLTPDNLREHC